MAKWKAKKRSDIQIPVDVRIGDDRFVFVARALTPDHQAELIKPHRERVLDTRTGQYEDRIGPGYADALFDAVFVRVEGLTPRHVEQMVELDTESDPLPINGDGKTITDKEFIRFIWNTAPARDLYTQVNATLGQALVIERQRKDLQEKNSVGSSDS
jgi:hypothetical protein